MSKKKKKKSKGKNKSNSKKRYSNVRTTTKPNNQNKNNLNKRETLEKKENVEEKIQEESVKVEPKEIESKKEKNNKKLQEKKERNRTGKKENNKQEKTKNKTEKKNANKKIIKRVFVILGIAILIVAEVMAYLMLRPKFKDIQIELGTKEIKVEDFLTSKIYKSKSEFITDISGIDLSKVGEYEITLKFMNKEQTVKLKIADTIPPEVKFKDITRYIDYQINPEDFIIDKKDESEMVVEVIEPPEISEFKDYQVTVKVKDRYNNETVKACKMTITWIRPECYIELGNAITLEDLVFDVATYGESVSKTDLDNVDTSVLGEYIVKAEKDGEQYETKVIVQDTTPPVLTLKDITIYDDETVKDYKNFITELSDASGEPTTVLKTEIDYSIVGEQNIIIEATDINGNKTEGTAILTIKKDTDGPVISGIKDMTVNKYAEIDYLSGVSANDRKDGRCEVTVDSSNINTSTAGTYYATYYAKDSKGNTTTSKRKITVNHDQDDTNEKLDQFYNSYCAGRDPVGIASAVREHIKYNSNWGGNDPVWYGLTEWKGNCYVHASVLNRLLEKAGYQNRIIYLTDQSHYWNLVSVGGVWRHLDGTPSPNHTLGLLTDEQKLADPGVHQKTWDREAWPAAE